MRRRVLYGVTGVLWVGALSVLSFLPSKDKHALHTHGRLHSPGHFAAFFVTAIVLLRIARTPAMRGVMLGVLVLLALGFEFGQSVLDGYGVEWHDVAFDLLGATLGAVAYALFGGMRDPSGVPRRVISRWRGRRG